MIRKFIAAFVLILFVSSATAFANASIDWERGVIRATGAGVPPSNRDARDVFAKTFARQAARMDALRQLAEIVVGVMVHSSIEIDPDGNLKRDYSKIELPHDSKVFKLLEKNARQVGKARFEDGICEVDMELILPADWREQIK